MHVVCRYSGRRMQSMVHHVLATCAARGHTVGDAPVGFLPPAPLQHVVDRVPERGPEPKHSIGTLAAATSVRHAGESACDARRLRRSRPVVGAANSRCRRPHLATHSPRRRVDSLPRELVTQATPWHAWISLAVPTSTSTGANCSRMTADAVLNQAASNFDLWIRFNFRAAAGINPAKHRQAASTGGACATLANHRARAVHGKFGCPPRFLRVIASTEACYRPVRRVEPHSCHGSGCERPPTRQAVAFASPWQQTAQQPAARRSCARSMSWCPQTPPSAKPG